MSNFAWMRILQVKLSNDKGACITYEDNGSGDGLEISIEGSKYLSAIKDACTITISNLTYSDIIRLIEGKYYNVEVRCGYRSLGTFAIFKGGVLYISNELNTDRSNDVIIVCASQFIAKAGQTRINLSPVSGVNYYSLIEYLNKKGNLGITMNVSESLKNEKLEASISENITLPNWLEMLLSQKQEYGINVDATDGYSVSIFNAVKDRRRTINISNSIIDLNGGFPRLTTSGVTFTVTPTRNYHCGDIIKLDNSLINMSVNSQTEAYKLFGHYLDQNGEYMIYQIDFQLTNRANAFKIKIYAKSLNLLTQIMK